MHENGQNDFSLKSFFIPLTTRKAIRIIVIVGLIVFFNTLFNGFVLDDKSYIIFNPDLHSLDITRLIGSNVFNTNVTGQYHPAAAIYFAIIYSIFRDIPFFYHFFQILLHIANAILLFILFRRFMNEKTSLFLSLIFLVHPIQTEAVSYIAATQDPLFFFLGINALLLNMKDVISPRRMVLIFTLLLLAILTKETAALFLIAALVYRILFKKKQVVIFILSGFITFLIYIFMRIGIAKIQILKPNLVPIANLTLLERLINLPAIVFYYVKTFLIPLQLSTSQLWVIKKIDLNNFYLPLLADFLFFLALLLLGIYIWKVHKKALHVFLFFSVWFSIGFALHSQIIPLDFTVADRFFYFPLAGLLGLLGLSAEYLKIFVKNKTAFYIIAVVLLTIFASRAMMRNTNWVDGLTLLKHDSKIHNNFIIESNIGVEYGFTRNYKEALKHYQKSVEMFPFDGNLYQIGFIYEQMGNIKKAKEYYYKAFAQKYSLSLPHKHNVIIYKSLGRLLMLHDDPHVARDFIRKALEDYPDEGKLWTSLALSEYKLNNHEEALKAAEKAKTLWPNEQTNYIYAQLLNKQPIQFKP